MSNRGAGGSHSSEEPPYEIVPPGASALSESLRAVGYSLESAVADLIDNSITAGARRVRVEFVWAGAGSRVWIADDGHGMTRVELIAAMRAGSRSPLEPRDPGDLARLVHE